MKIAIPEVGEGWPPAPVDEAEEDEFAPCRAEEILDVIEAAEDRSEITDAAVRAVVRQRTMVGIIEVRMAEGW